MLKTDVLGCDARYCDRTVPTFGGTCWLHLRGRTGSGLWKNVLRIFLFICFLFIPKHLYSTKKSLCHCFIFSPPPLHPNAVPAQTPPVAFLEPPSDTGSHTTPGSSFPCAYSSCSFMCGLFSYRADGKGKVF